MGVVDARAKRNACSKKIAGVVFFLLFVFRLRRPI